MICAHIQKYSNCYLAFRNLLYFQPFVTQSKGGNYSCLNCWNKKMWIVGIEMFELLGQKYVPPVSQIQSFWSKVQSICSYSQIEASSLKCLSQCSWPRWLLLIVWRGGGYRVEMMHAGMRSGGRSIRNSWSLFRLLRFPNSDQTQTLAHTWQPTTQIEQQQTVRNLKNLFKLRRRNETI